MSGLDVSQIHVLVCLIFVTKKLPQNALIEGFRIHIEHVLSAPSAE